MDDLLKAVKGVPKAESMRFSVLIFIPKRHLLAHILVGRADFGIKYKSLLRSKVFWDILINKEMNIRI